MLKRWISNILRFRSIYSKYKNKLFIFLLLDIMCILLLVISPYFSSQIIIQLINKNYNLIIVYVLLLIINKGLFVVFNLVGSKVFLSFRKSVMIDFKREVSSSIIEQDIVIFQNNRKGKYINRLIQDIDEIPNHITYLRDYIKVLLTNILTIFYIIYLDYRIGLIYLVSLIIMIYIKVIGINYKSSYTKKFLFEKDKVSNNIGELYNGFTDVKQLGLGGSFNKRIEEGFINSESYQYKGDYINNIFYISSRIIEWISSLLVIFVGVLLIKKDMLLVDTFITIFMYRSVIFSVDGCVSDAILRISLMNISCDRLFEIWDNTSKRQDNYDNKKCIGNIEFKNVSFKYDKKLVLNNCSFKIKKNNLYILSGKSGSGKSTIFNLLTRLYDNYDGKILLDNIDIREYDKKFIINNISIISQNYYLFDMSIKDNLLLSNKDIKMGDIIKVCKSVGIHDDIEKLDKKYDTIIGEGAKFLSGGQRQRIAIARSILMNRKIILFDEATANLDSELEDTIFRLVNELKRSHTIIFITHNKDIIKNYSNVLILEKGKVK